MTFRGPGFLGRMIRHHAHPLISLPVCRLSSLLTGEDGGGGRGDESCDRKKAWPSINRSILPVSIYL
jgi:hypothetical protein